jgi:hypothetical protein
VKPPTVKEEQFLTDAKGKRTGVVLDLNTYERLREAEEELAELQAYDAARPKALSEIASGSPQLSLNIAPAADGNRNEISGRPAQVGAEGTGSLAG